MVQSPVFRNHANLTEKSPVLMVLNDFYTFYSLILGHIIEQLFQLCIEDGFCCRVRVRIAWIKSSAGV